MNTETNTLNSRKASVKVGPKMEKALLFAKKYRGWNTFNKSEKRVMERLKGRGLIKVNGEQFKISEKGLIYAYGKVYTY